MGFDPSEGMVMEVLGIDIGGSGIKAAPVDVSKGELLRNRNRIKTPQPGTPEAVLAVIEEQVAHFSWSGPVGVGFPGPIRRNTPREAVNLDDSWVGVDGAAEIARRTGCRAVLVNDADAAGLAEMTFGAGRDVAGLVLLITIGTGLGTALFHDGRLIPNTEFGHIEMFGRDAEELAAESARKRNKWSWSDWSSHFEEYLRRLERLLWPDLFILGGGGAKKPDKFLPRIQLSTPIEIARFGNRAGIVGAAQAAGAALGEG